MPLFAKNVYLDQIKGRLTDWTSGSTNQRVFGAMVIIVICTILVKIASLLKDVIVAGLFGTGDALDALLIAYLLPSFVINVFAGAFGNAVVPTYIQVRDNEGEAAARELVSGILILVLGLLIFITGCFALIGPFILPYLASGFGAEKMELTQELFYWFLPVIIIAGVGRVYRSLLYAEESFALGTYAPSTDPIICISGLLIFGASFGIYTLVACMILGVVLEILMLSWGMKEKNICLVPKWTGLNAAIRQVIVQYKPMVAGQFLMWSAKVVDRSMAAMLASGSVSALTYGAKIVSGVKGIGAMALGRAILPYYSKMAAKEDWSGIAHTLKTYFSWALKISIPLTILLVVVSEPLVRVVYQRGSFTTSDTILVAQVQAMYLLQLPFYVLNVLGVRLLSALKKNHILMKVSVVNLVANISLNILFMKYFGVAGIALSTSISYLISAVLIYLNLFNCFKKVAPEFG